MGLKHVVITSVTRDDLQDGGAGHFAVTIRETRRALPGARIEVLTPDFAGSRDSIARVLDAAPDIFNHNVETVPRLYSRVRPQAVYARSLGVLAFARSYYPDVLAKSGFMVGLGEEPAEVELLLRELRTAGVDIVTIGQYLQPFPQQPARGGVHFTGTVRGVPEFRPRYWIPDGFQRSICSKAHTWPMLSAAQRWKAQERLLESREFALGLFTAALLILCFPNFDIAFLAPVALVPLLVAVGREASVSRRFLIGYAAGVAFWAGTCYWIQDVLSVYGGMNTALSWLGFAIFALWKGLQMGIFAVLAGMALRRSWAVIAVPAIWVAIEWTHGPLAFGGGVRNAA